MAGVYIHIPFCKKACHYCDFHFSTSMKYREEMVRAIGEELLLRKDYLPEKRVETIYFGGGTPSLLSAGEINRLIGSVESHFEIAGDCEITLEANPDDLNREKVAGLRQTPVNRLSIGVQSFHEEDLCWMNRAHTAGEAQDCIKRVQDAGLENLTIDLIYGYPLLTEQKWLGNIRQAVQLEVPHLSCYALTVEPETALAVRIRKGSETHPDEDQAARQFEILTDRLEEQGFLHYEISSFCKQGRYSRHNTAYWEQKPYLGLGPSAHSYNGGSRQWNIANNHKYLEGIAGSSPAYEIEELSAADRFNEYVMTRLRTMWGIDRGFVRERFGPEWLDSLDDHMTAFQDKGWTGLEGDRYVLTRQGKLMADRIASGLFISDTE